MEMENISTTLQEFLDGSLPPEDEAELLHRLSVSPERRDQLRSFMKQQQIINNDRAAIAVPYSAEQKLWAALAEMPPFTAPVAEGVSTVVRTGAVASSAFMKIAATAVVAVTIGFLSGYFFSEKQTTQFAVVAPSANTNSSNSIPSNSSAPVASQLREIKNNTRVQERNIDHRSQIFGTVDQSVSSSEAPLYQDHSTDVNADQAPALSSIGSKPVSETIPELPAIAAAPMMIREPNYQQPARPRLWSDESTPSRHEPTILDRLELSIHEGIGKQFPNSDATNVSMPWITNSDVTLKYMIIPELWIGAGGGMTNMTQKELYEYVSSDPLAQHIAKSNLVHEKTAWFGGLVEFRQPISSVVEFAANGGIAASRLGPIFSGELGLRYEISNRIGALGGIRATRITSNVAKQLSDMISSSNQKTGLGLTPGVTDDPPNYNLEFSTGIYFRF